MPFPGYSEEFQGLETFFEPTRIWLFGKPFEGLAFNQEAMVPEFSNYRVGPDGKLPMPPRRIERTLRRGREADPPIPQIFARIYSFSYEGHFYTLPRPLLFLLYGRGTPLAPPKQPAPGERKEKQRAGAPAPMRGATDEAADVVKERKRRNEALKKGEEPNDEDQRKGPIPPQEPHPVSGHVKFNTKFTGIDARSWYFSDDILVWAVDRRDLGVCMDVEIANYQDLLLLPMQALSRGPGSRSDMISRSDMVSRSDMTSRSDATSRGGGFRSDMVGPHQNW